MKPPKRLDVARHDAYKRHGIDWRVIANGRDVTDDCYEAIAGENGVAKVFVRGPRGSVLVDRLEDGPKRRALLTRVEFREAGA
jgi:hypothetical protein